MSQPTRSLVTVLRPAAFLLILAAVIVSAWRFGASASASGVALPRPALDPAPAASGPVTAVFAGGCFWGVQAVFEHVNGVTLVVAGYTGGAKVNPTYEDVSTEKTGHAESVRVTYDPAKVSYGTLLQVFFSVAHDPTELDRQGPDVGPSYRSNIFGRTMRRRRWPTRVSRSSIKARVSTSDRLRGTSTAFIRPRLPGFSDKNPNYRHRINDRRSFEFALLPALYRDAPVTSTYAAKAVDSRADGGFRALPSRTARCG